MTRKLKVALILMVLALALPVLAAAQAGSVPVPGPLGPAADVPALAGKIVALAAAVAAVLQGIKKWIPALAGTPARVISILLAFAGAYAAAPAGDVLSINFFVTAISTALGANGIHSLFRQT